MAASPQASRFGGGFGDGGFGPTASQVGGGFSSQGGFSQGGTPSKSKFANATLHPCTVKQLTSIQDPGGNGNATVDGKEITQVRICGQIRSMNQASTFTSYEIDDGTGMMNVKNWATPEEQQYQLSENQYAMVYGRVSFYEGRVSVTAFSIRPLTDFNELTYHLCETAVAHKVNTSSMGKQASFFGKPATQPNFGGNGGGFGGGGFGGAPAQSGFGGGNSGGDSGFGGGDFEQNEEMTPLQNQILQICTQYAGGDEGIHVDQITSTIGSGASVNDIREALEWLTNEGQLYSTIDDEHFKSTSGD